MKFSYYLELKTAGAPSLHAATYFTFSTVTYENFDCLYTSLQQCIRNR